MLGIGDVDWDTAGTDEADSDFTLPRRRRPQPADADVVERYDGESCALTAGRTPGPAARLSAAPPAAAPSARSRCRFRTAREDHPFGPEAHVFKVGGGSTMFAILSDGPPVTVTLKLTREEREVALTLPFVSEARYVGRYGWVTARVEDEPTAWRRRWSGCARATG